MEAAAAGAAGGASGGGASGVSAGAASQFVLMGDAKRESHAAASVALFTAPRALRGRIPRAHPACALNPLAFVCARRKGAVSVLFHANGHERYDQ